MFEIRSIPRKTLFTLTAIALMGCNGGSKDVAQDTMCVYSTEEEAKLCKDGKMSWFKPRSWGNEQLPLIVAAAYCDFNHQVVMNNAGVICTFNSQRQSAEQKSEKTK